MAAPSTNLLILKKTSQEGILEFCKKTTELAHTTWDYRSRLTQIDKEYYRKNLTTRDAILAGDANARGKKNKLTDLVVPIVEPQIQTSLAYLVSVFLTGQPIFGMVADPANITQAKIYEAIVDDQARRGSWVREFMLFFLDGLKYNFQIMELCWWAEKTYDPHTVASKDGLSVEQRQIIWQGNKASRRDPYNVIFDARVIPAEMHKKGEFAGYVELIGRIALKEYIQNLSTRMNVKEAMESAVGNGGVSNYYIPQINWNALVQQNMSRGMDWLAWAAMNQPGQIDYKNIYELTTRYCRIVPSDFGIDVPAKNTVQIWKFVTVNDAVLVFAEKQTNAHNMLPMLFGQPVEDGLGYQTDGQAAKLIPLQDTASVLWNARLASQRRAISDRGIYNPSLIRAEDINNENPAAKIPCRPAAYMTDMRQAYYPIPYEDRQSTSFVSDAMQMQQFANFISGQNAAQQGQFVKGNKTQSEFENIMGNSSGRQQMLAQFMESQVMVPFKEMLKINVMQYATPGQVFSTVDRQTYPVDPVALRQAQMAYKVTDGLLPSDKIINAQTMQVAFQTIASVPSLQMGYDMTAMFTYMMKTQNVDLSAFEVKQQATAQANAVPPPGAQGAPTTGVPPAGV